MGGNLSMSNFAPTGWSCADGYSGTPEIQVCSTAGGEYTVSGCEPVCSHPAAPTGYIKGTMGGNLSMSNFAPVGWSCADGYSGTPEIQICSTAGGEYTVSGCEPVCSHPAAPTGYIKGTMGGNLSMGSDFAPTGWSCADGYSPMYESGKPQTQICSTAGGEYTVSGCEPVCSHPNAPTGYIKGTMGGKLSMNSDFAPTGWSCADGYSGTPITEMCSTPGGEYTLSGCEEKKPGCVHPAALTGYTNLKNWYNLQIKADAKPSLSMSESECSEYATKIGANFITNDSAEDDPEGCTVKRDLSTVYFNKNLDGKANSWCGSINKNKLNCVEKLGGNLSLDDFAPTGWSCADGYIGTPEAQVCSAVGGEYTLSGCEKLKTRCTRSDKTYFYDGNLKRPLRSTPSVKGTKKRSYVSGGTALSSMIVPNGCKVTLYYNTRYRGAKGPYGPGTYNQEAMDKTHYNFNNRNFTHHMKSYKIENLR